MPEDEWQYETAPDLDRTLIERLRRFPREPDILMYGLRSIAASVVASWLRLYHRLEVQGREHLPIDGSFVLCSNHQSHLDALSVLAALPFRRLHRTFVAAAEDYFFTSAVRTFVSAVAVNALPFSRRVSSRHSIEVCRELISRAGNVLVIFPEGTRSTDGRMGQFKPGIGRLLAATAVPALPCYLAGAFEALPKGRIVPRPAKLSLFIGPGRRYDTVAPDAGGARSVAGDLEQAVRELEALHGSP